MTAELDTLSPESLTPEDVQAAVTEALMEGEDVAPEDLLDVRVVRVREGGGRTCLCLCVCGRRGGRRPCGFPRH